MAASLALAFGLAGFLSLVLTPIARDVALRTGFVDAPSARKMHARAVPYLGGAAVALATGAAFFTVRGFTKSAALLVGAVVLGVVGGLDDRFELAPSARLAAEAFASVMAVVAGVRIQLSGVDAIDVVLTIVWIVGITNALNIVDNMDGLSSGLTAIAGAGIAVLGGLQGQEIVGAVGAAVAGACVGFLFFNWHPARIYLGDLGALFLGFLLAVASIELTPAIAPPDSEVVPILLLAIPLLDTATVTVERVRHGRHPFVGGQDHLSHRLRHRYGSTTAAVALLLAAQACCAVLAVVSGYDLMNPWLAAAGGVVVLGVVGAMAWTVPVYGSPPTVLARRAWLGGLCVAAPFVVAVALGNMMR
jgi:UDP-GlcNAc:undecaprenyl-phosphate GlcNAc-1-phosphate transferase